MMLLPAALGRRVSLLERVGRLNRILWFQTMILGGCMALFAMLIFLPWVAAKIAVR